jgi:hypothetical protein
MIATNESALAEASVTFDVNLQAYLFLRHPMGEQPPGAVLAELDARAVRRRQAPMQAPGVFLPDLCGWRWR